MSPIDCEDQELLEGFLTETTELLEKLDDDLVALEKATDQADLLNSIFRSIHTVKGASSFLGFDLLVRVTHKTEDVLNRLRKGELAVTPEIMDIVLEATDLVKLLVSDIKRERYRTVRSMKPFPNSSAADGYGTRTTTANNAAAGSSPVAEPAAPATDQQPVAATETAQPAEVPKLRNPKPRQSCRRKRQLRPHSSQQHQPLKHLRLSLSPLQNLHPRWFRKNRCRHPSRLKARETTSLTTPPYE
jgi:two-component system chemotaxis sensor kinase CheA